MASGNSAQMSSWAWQLTSQGGCEMCYLWPSASLSPPHLSRGDSGDNMKTPNIHQTLNNLDNPVFSIPFQPFPFPSGWNRKMLLCFSSLCSATFFPWGKEQGEGQRGENYDGKWGWTSSINVVLTILPQYIHCLLWFSHFCEVNNLTSQVRRVICSASISQFDTGFFLSQKAWDPNPACTPQTPCSFLQSLLPGKLDSSPPTTPGLFPSSPHFSSCSPHPVGCLPDHLSLSESCSSHGLHKVFSDHFGWQWPSLSKSQGWGPPSHCLSHPALHHSACQVLAPTTRPQAPWAQEPYLCSFKTMNECTKKWRNR